MTREEIIQILAQVKYPGFSKDIISFGMLKEILVEKNQITINLSQSTNQVDVLDSIKTDILNKISKINKANKDVNINYIPSENLNKSNISLNNTKNIKNIIAIASGKGGVGKSTVAINIASELSKNYKVGLLDLDIYGPSLPTLIAEKSTPQVKENNLLIPIEKFGIKFMSFGFLNSTNDPAIWRGPMVSKLTHQFFDNVDWGNLDYLILDLPPGTGDIQLTLVQKIALTGAIIVTTPQDLAHKDVQKGSDMFEKVNTPVLGVIENMAYYRMEGRVVGTSKDNLELNIKNLDDNITVDDNGKFDFNIEIFKGKSGEKESKRLDIPLLGSLPLEPNISLSSDMGRPYIFDNESSCAGQIFSDIIKKIIKIVENK